MLLCANSCIEEGPVPDLRRWRSSHRKGHVGHVEEMVMLMTGKKPSDHRRSHGAREEDGESVKQRRWHRS
jgi:hypothetical protein